MVSQTAVAPLFNGNISETFWRTAGDNKIRKYGYQYDNLNRLTNAIFQDPSLTVKTYSYDESLTYDKNGNILTLLRKNYQASSPYNNTMDNLVYTYDTANKNQLKKVDDATTNTKGFRELIKTTDEYLYDAYGNLTIDKNKGITAISYNQLNLPLKIEFGTNKIEYLYNATGQKVQKKVTQGSTVTTTDYLGGFQYNGTALDFFPHAEGYIKRETTGVYTYVFNYTDHLGNVRVSYKKNGSTLQILEESNYYPFGLKHEPNTVVNNQPSYKYKYQGQERQDELGLNWDSFKWRNYDYAIGRFMSIDPLAEKYVYNRPYNFSENRVIDGRELEGLEWVDSKNVPVYDPTLNNGKGDFTAAATSNHRNLARSLNQTDAGKAQFNKLVNSTTPVETVLNTKDRPVDEKGLTTLAETTFTNLMEGEDPDTGKVEDVSFSKSTITFYMQNIDEVSAVANDGDSKTGASMYGTKVPEGFNFSEIIGAIFGHEIGYTNKNNVLTWAQGGDHEKEPSKIHTEIINETKENKKQ